MGYGFPLIHEFYLNHISTYGLGHQTFKIKRKYEIQIQNKKKQNQRGKPKTARRQSLNPRGSVSLTQPHRGGAPMRKQDGSILLSSVGRQVALATMPRYIGLKLGVLTFCLL